ncbi:hypothetical protein [Rhodopirellula bahusiensis]
MTSLLTQLCGQPVGAAISPALMAAICRTNDDELPPLHRRVHR